MVSDSDFFRAFFRNMTSKGNNDMVGYNNVTFSDINVLSKT